MLFAASDEQVWIYVLRDILFQLHVYHEINKAYKLIFMNTY